MTGWNIYAVRIDVELMESREMIIRCVKRWIKQGIISLLYNVYKVLYGNIFFTHYSVTDLRDRKEKEDNYQYTVCYVAGLGWNALDWWMPVLVWLKEYHPKCKRISLLTTPNTMDTMRKERQRYEMLREVSDVIIYNDYTEKSLLPHRLYRAVESRFVMKYGNIVPALKETVLAQLGNIDAILMGGDWELCDLAKFLKGKFPSSIVCVSPIVDFSQGMRLHSGKFPCDYYLYTDFFNQLIDEQLREKCILTGAPRGDLWWIHKRKEDSMNLLMSKQFRAIGKPVITCLIAQQREFVGFPESWRLAFSLFMRKHPEFFYIIKFHPRDTSAEREKFLQEKVPENVQWEETSRQLLDLQFVSDLIIIVGPSDSTTSLLMYDEVPVITFWDSYDSSANSWRKNYQMGERTLGFFERNELVLHADNIMELERCVYSLLYDNVWEEYKGKYHKYLPGISNPCKLIVDFLYDHFR